MASKRILVFQHVAWEILGTLNPMLKESGFRIRYVNFARDTDFKASDVDRYDGLIILGGPMSVNDTAGHPHLKVEIETIQRAIQNRTPIFGICLGAQLIAKALGAKIKKSRQKEIGWFDVELTDLGKSHPLFTDFESTERIFQWHTDAFEIPKDAIQLARSEGCENQAFSYGDRVFGFQFHLEVDTPMIHRWLEEPTNQAELSENDLKNKIHGDTPGLIDRSCDLGQKSFGHFIDVLGRPGRQGRLVLDSGHRED